MEKNLKEKEKINNKKSYDQLAVDVAHGDEGIVRGHAPLVFLRRTGGVEDEEDIRDGDGLESDPVALSQQLDLVLGNKSVGLGPD